MSRAIASAAVPNATVMGNRKARFLLIPGFWLLALTLSSRAQALDNTGATVKLVPIAQQSRPASIPDGFLLTPRGYFHESCVKPLDKGDVVAHDIQAIRHLDGTISALAVCQFPFYTAKGEAVYRDARPTRSPDISNEYLEYAETYASPNHTDSASFAGVIGQFNVPPAPASTSQNLTLFFWPGLIDAQEYENLLQPVLAWSECYGTT